MMEIYTPKEWDRFFGGAPSLYIKDDGYIYTREEEVRLMGRPCGRIDYSKGYIYGSDYASVNPVPVGYLQRKNGITEIYAEYPGWNVKPILVIKGNEIYTYSEFTRIIGGNVSGYIKNDDHSGNGGSSGRSGYSKSDSSSGPSGDSTSRGSFDRSGSSGSGCLGEMGVFAVIIGFFLLLTLVDEIRQKGAKFWIPFIILSGLMFWGRYLRNKHAQGNSNPASKPNPSPKPQPKPVPKPQPKPVPNPKPAPRPRPAETKIISCPHCGAKCRVPGGNGKIRLTCPNPACRQQYEIDT